MSDLPDTAPEDDAEEASADTTPHSHPEQWMLPARLDGVEWGDISDHVGSGTEAALADGHTQEDIDKHLGYGDQDGNDWMHSIFGGLFSRDPSKKGGTDLSATGTHRDDYTRALLDGTVKTSGEFADAYGSASATAAHADGEPASKDEQEKRLRAYAAAAEGLGATLPDRTDFVDAAARVTDADPEHADSVRRNMIDHWRKTGQHPNDVVRAMSGGDPELGSAMNVDRVDRNDREDPGFLWRTVLGTGKNATGIFGLPNLAAQAIDQIGGHLDEPGFLTRHTMSAEEMQQSYQNGLDILTGLFGAKPLDLTPHSGFEDHMQQILGSVVGGGPFAATKIGALTLGSFPEIMNAYSAVRDSEPVKSRLGEQTPIEQLVVGMAAGAIAHRVSGGAVKAFSPKEGFDSFEALPPQEMTHNDLLHHEAQEMALEPGFAKRLAADESGKLDLTGQGGDVAAKKRPAYSFEDKGIEEGLTEEGKSIPTKQFTIHRDGEPVGFAEAAFPTDQPGHARIENIATDERAGSLGPRAVRDLATQFFEAHPDINSISGFRVTGARIREGSGPSDMVITREQIEKHNPAHVKELAEGYHTSGVLDTAVNALRGTLADTSGSLRLNLSNKRVVGRDPEGEVMYQRSKFSRRLFADSWTGRGGESKREWRGEMRYLEDSKAYQWAAKHTPEWEAAVKAGSGWYGTEVGKFWQAVHGQAALAPNHPMAPVIEHMRDWYDQQHQRIAQWHEEGLVGATDYIKGYVPGMWENPSSKYIGETDRPNRGIFGNEKAWKDKEYQHIFEGLAAGETPKFMNPFEHYLEGVKQFEGKAFQMELLRDLGTNIAGAGMVEKLQPGMVRLRDTTYGSKFGAAPEGYAKLYNRAYANGMVDPTGQSMLNRLQYAVNALNSLKLLLPIFHMRTVWLGSVGDGIGQALEEVGRGLGRTLQGDFAVAADQFKRAVWTAAVTVPTAGLGKTVSSFINGRRANEMYELVKKDEVTDSLTRAGMSFGRGTFEHVSRDPSVHISMKRNWQPDEGIVGNIGNMFKAAYREQSRKFANDFGAGTDASLANKFGLPMVARIGDHALTEAERFATTSSHFFFQYLIPRLEQGAAVERLNSWRAANKGASLEDMDRYARKVVMDQENRKGELNLNNVFWPNSVKQSANLALLSLGWKLGTWRGVAQATGWDPDTKNFRLFSNPVALTSTIGTAVAWGQFNAIMQYMHTGTLPWQTDTPMKDFLLYRTGESGKRFGATVPSRGLVPGEAKEVYDMAHVLFTSLANPHMTGTAITEYVMNATNPFWHLLSGLAKDEDGIGHHIGEYPGGLRRFMESEFTPLFLEAAKQNKVDSGIPQWEAMLGSREAASWAENPAGYDKFVKSQSDKWRKQELQRARKEAAMYQNSEWLKDYIKEAEEANANAYATGGGLTLTRKRKTF